MVLYLDDNTPVRTIEVRNVSVDICAAYLRGHFEAVSGPVSNVSFVNHHSEDDERVAHVTFVRPEDAARLLGKIAFPRFPLKFTIKQAGNAFQPKPDPNAMKFEEINNDCMLRIASYLTLVDIINLSGTSIRMRAFAEQIFRKKTHFSYDLPWKTIKNTNLEMVLQAIGVYIESIEWLYIECVHLDLLATHCPNVRVVRLLYPALPSGDWKRNKKFFAKLETLSIYHGGLYDASLKVMVSSPELKSLELRSCSCYRGKFLSRLKSSKLKELAINMSPNNDDVLNFVRTKKLVKFSCESFRFDQSATLPPETVAEIEEIELNFSHATDDNLTLFATKDFKRLTNLALNLYHVPAPLQYKILIAAGQITTLQSLTFKGLELDAAIFNCLGLFKNIKRVRFMHIINQIGRTFFSTLHTHLPNITEIHISPFDSSEIIEPKWICGLIGSLRNLKCFSHSTMTWQLINMVVQEQQRLKRSTIKIMVDLQWFWYPEQGANAEEKKKFDRINKGTVKVMPSHSHYF